jgi:hypothetical protein
VRKYNLNTALTSALRKTWRNYPPRREAILAAKDPRNPKHIICAECETSVHEKLCHCDHIVPVVGANGFVSWDQKIERMFVAADGYQILCESCHENKTAKEREEKKLVRRALKPKKEPKRARKKTK